VVEEIRGGGASAVFYPADLSSLEQVRALAAAVRRDQARLDVLINNAGIGTRSGGSQRRVGADGHELRFAVNYLSGFLLTHLLLPLLQANAPARIVNVASAGQSAIDFNDVMLTKSYEGVQAYCQSKLAQIMFTIDLAQQLEARNITVNCLHPATYMATTMVREAGVSPASTVEEGAEAILKLAVSPDLEGRTGLYFNRMQEARAHPQAYDADARARLRRLSLELVGLGKPARE
jgi:NAD(P)-dependent dehydrogenase (short-subunit alcohol dehydrogenase family)